jgi:hypothetical protein
VFSGRDKLLARVLEEKIKAKEEKKCLRSYYL